MTWRVWHLNLSEPFSRCTYGMNFIILQVIHKLSMSPSGVTTISHRPFTAAEWNDIPVSYVNACVITFWVLMAQMWHPVIAHQNTLNELQKLSRKKRLNYWSNPATICRLQLILKHDEPLIPSYSVFWPLAHCHPWAAANIDALCATSSVVLFWDSVTSDWWNEEQQKSPAPSRGLVFL